jgi:uncharacterized protein
VSVITPVRPEASRIRLTRFSTSRRKFLGLAAAAGAVAIGCDSILLEPNHPHIVRQEIALRRWPAQLNGFRIALLSDFHYDAHFSAHPLRAAIGMVNSLSPDMIVLTGDFVTASEFDGDEEKAAAHAEPCAALLRQMNAPLGLWAVLGNHDWATNPRFIAHALREAGIQVLANRSVAIETAGARFWLSGVDDVMFGPSDLDMTLANVPADEANVLLVHEPDFADRVARHPVDLQLSGHSHGGQVRLPFLPPPFLPALARKYYQGLHKIGSLTLYTNIGLGTMGLPIRWNCPPEITLVTLRSPAA